MSFVGHLRWKSLKRQIAVLRFRLFLETERNLHARGFNLGLCFYPKVLIYRIIEKISDPFACTYDVVVDIFFPFPTKTHNLCQETLRPPAASFQELGKSSANAQGLRKPVTPLWPTLVGYRGCLFWWLKSFGFKRKQPGGAMMPLPRFSAWKNIKKGSKSY